MTPEWASEESIKDQFAYQNIGLVERVDLIHKTSAENGSEYYQAFVHFKEWFDTPATRNIQERIEAQDEEHPARLVVDDPWYWLLLRNSNPRSEAERRMEGRIRVLELAMQERALISTNFQQRMECVAEDLQNRLYDLELEYQYMMHSDAAREDTLVYPGVKRTVRWDMPTPTPTPTPTATPTPTPTPIGGATVIHYTDLPDYINKGMQCFDTVDDDREIKKWEDEHQAANELCELWCDP